MSKFIYQFQQHSLANGARLQINTNARYLLILGWTGATDVDIELNNEPPQKIPAGLAINLRSGDEPIEVINFINNTGGTGILKIGLSNEVVFDNRTVINGSISAEISPASTFSISQVAVNNSADQIIAANAGRKRVTIKVPVTASEAVFIGPANTVAATTGHRLDPGDAITLENTSAVWGIVAGAGTVTVTVLEE